jgi:1A family penicillin-binding protein
MRLPALRLKLLKLKKLHEKGMHKEILIELWKTFKRPLFFAAFAAVVVLALTPIATYLYFARDLSSKENIMNRNNQGVILTDRNDKPFFTLYQARTKEFVPLSQIPKHTQQAVIAVEDKNFYDHPGFSPTAIVRAFIENIREERIAQGGSTITQQLVKNVLLTPDKNLLRKYQEVVLALEIDRRFTKDEILEMYLNSVYLGEGALGFEDAANTYFNKPASQLTLAESALLTAILPAPSALSPISGNAERAFERQKVVLSLMQQQGYITPAQRQQAEQEDVRFTPTRDTLNLIAPHFALMVKEELIKKYGENRVARSGFTVRTTLDITKQDFAENTVNNHVSNLARNKATNGAAVAIDPKTGEIIALVGSKDWYDEANGKINMAVRPRQPGSSFKPIVYAKAIEDRVITAATVIDDKAVSYGNYKPKNYDNRFRGKVTIRRALANSLNIPAVETLNMIGIPSALSYAEQLGITTLENPSQYGLSLVLGAAEIPLVEMTSAFSAFANQGQRIPPTTILQIMDKRGDIIYEHQPSAKSAVDNAVAYIISSILSDNTARAEVFGNSLSLSRPAAVKTGTTEDYRDALTIGYTPNLVVGVWVGNNDNSPMDNIAGSLGAAPIWRRIMENFLIGMPVERFTPPPSVRSLAVCRENGLRVKNATSSAMTEFFLRGTEPTKFCDSPESQNNADNSPTPTETEDREEQNNDQDETPTPTPTSEPTPTEASLPTATPPVALPTL